MTYTAEMSELAELVANEVLQAFNSHDGPKWETIDGEEKAVSFVVDVPSITGKTVQELNPRGLRSTGDFDSRLNAVGVQYVNGYRTGEMLHGIHFQLEIIDGAYTGKATVRDRSGAFDYDL
tara:strand:+ start:232 stop:594 length:363 start_codon:yes stop_codon:yes gene_type:complete